MLLARIAPGLATLSSLEKISRLTPISSKAASMTMSASPAFSRPIAPVIRPTRSSRWASVIEPRLAEPA